MKSRTRLGVAAAMVLFGACATGTVGERPELTSSGAGTASATGTVTGSSTGTQTGGVGGAGGAGGGGVGLVGGTGGAPVVDFCPPSTTGAELVGVLTPSSGQMCIDATEVT